MRLPKVTETKNIMKYIHRSESQMKNYMPLIATQILNIELYTLFRVKGKELHAHGNQTYYLGYDGLHSTKDEINIDSELLNKILTGKAEIIYIKNKNKIPDNMNIRNLEINAIADRFKLGNLNLIEWRFIYYLISKNTNKNKTQIVSFREFEYIYKYTTNTITNEKIMLESLLKKGLLLNYKKIENREIEITFSDILLSSIRKSNYKYEINNIAEFKHTASYLLYDYFICQLKKDNFRVVELKINELKRICSINTETYPRCIDLKNIIILPSIIDINNFINKNNHGVRVFYDNIKKIELL